MKKYLLMLTIALIMTGCTKVSETVMEPESIPEREQVSEMENVWEAENLQETEVLSEAEVLLAEETVQEEVFRNEEQTIQSGFDASQTVDIEEIADGIRVTFHQLPKTAADMQAIVDMYTNEDARAVCAFFHAALVRYSESAEDCFAMMDILRGPQPLSDGEKAFIKERLSDKLYLPKAYFEGAEPKNEYEPQEPWSILIYNDPVKPPEGYAYTMVRTSGADSSRRIVMRIKDGQHYLWEYNAALLSIRLPASEDPWA